MNVETVFIKTIVQDYISQTHPEEDEFLAAYLQQAEKSNFNVERGMGQDISFGFGGIDLIGMFQSPVVIQILSGIWRDVLTPLSVEILKKRLAKDEKIEVSEQILKNISRKKLRDYIRGQAQKKLLTDEEANDIAERVMDWLRRHPEDVKLIISKPA